MRFEALILFFAAISLLYACPFKCTCTDENSSIKCNGLLKKDMDNFYKVVSSPEFANLKSFTMRGSHYFDLDSMPSLASLEEMDLSYNGLTEPWTPDYVRFRSVRKLNIEHNNFNAITRALLYPFPAIEELYAGFNNVTAFIMDSLRMPKLRTIKMNDNKIVSIGMPTLRFMPFLTDVDFSGNQLRQFATSDFALVGSLRYVNLSRNRIESYERDTATVMPSLEILDLSFNLLEHMPRLELTDLTGLRTLNLSHNNIRVVGERHIELNSIRVLDLSHTGLTVVESAAFSSMPELHTLYLNNNPLTFLSPTALENSRVVHSLDIRDTNLKTLSLSILHNVAQIHVNNVPLDCGCLATQLINISTTEIVDWEVANCKTRRGTNIMLADLSSHALHSEDSCRPEALLPMGTELEATIGQTFTIFCAGSNEDDIVTWKTPSGVVEVGKKPERTTNLERLDYFTTTLFEPKAIPVNRKRALATSEYFRLDVVLAADNGTYECSVKRGDKVSTRIVHLNVITPKIELEIIEMGISYFHLGWSHDLNVQAADRVYLLIGTKSRSNEYVRPVQLPLQSLYRSYNLINLAADTNYTVCMSWYMTDDSSEIYSTCVTAKTARIPSMAEQISPELIIGVCLIVSCVVLYMCASHIYRYLHVFNTAKNQSKLIQSVSGQSILSQSISNDTTMFENLQLETTTSSCRSTARDSACGPLLDNDL